MTKTLTSTPFSLAPEGILFVKYRTALSGITFASVIFFYSIALSQDHVDREKFSPHEFTLVREGAFILNADDIQGMKWMRLSRENRSSFVLGFLAGLDHVYNSAGLFISLRHSLSALELGDEVYKGLLEQPDLSTGPMDAIILSSLEDVLFISLLSNNNQLIHLRGASKQWPETATATFISHHQKEK